MQASDNCEGSIAREREHLLEQLRLQRIQNDLAASQRQRGISNLHRLEQSMTDIQEEEAEITIENKVADQQNFQRIGQLEMENVQLEGQYQELLAEVGRLQYELRV